MDLRRNRCAVLVVEDDPEQQRRIAAHLESNGYTAVAVETGEEALMLAENVHLDLILIDVGLPGMSGWETLARLRALPWVADIPVVMLTSGPETVPPAEGAQYFVPKPWSESELLKGVRLLAG